MDIQSLLIQSLVVLGIAIALLSIYGSSQPRSPHDADKPQPPPSHQATATDSTYPPVTPDLDLSQQAIAQANRVSFECLQTLLTNYPSVIKMAQVKPDLPVKNIVPMFTALDNVLKQWGYDAIGQPWESVSYDPQLHQADVSDITVGETVVVRFVGYRQGDRILCPAKVSRSLPSIAQTD